MLDQPARLKVAIAVRVITHTLPQIDVADGAPLPRVNDRNGILTAVGDEDPPTIRRYHHVPRLGSGEKLFDQGGFEVVWIGIVNPDHTHVIGGRVGGGRSGSCTMRAKPLHGSVSSAGGRIERL